MIRHESCESLLAYKVPNPARRSIKFGHSHQICVVIKVGPWQTCNTIEPVCFNIWNTNQNNETREEKNLSFIFSSIFKHHSNRRKNLNEAPKKDFYVPCFIPASERVRRLMLNKNSTNIPSLLGNSLKWCVTFQITHQNPPIEETLRRAARIRSLQSDGESSKVPMKNWQITSNWNSRN